MQSKGWWQKTLLREFANDCICHCVLPLKMQTVTATWAKISAHIDLTDETVVKAQRATLHCYACNSNTEGSPVLFGMRIVIAKRKAISVSDGTPIFIYRFGFGTANICKKCIPRQYSGFIINSDAIMIDYVWDNLESSASIMEHDRITVDLTGSEILQELLAIFQFKYRIMMRNLRKDEPMCANCKKPRAKQICSRCNYARYCNATCSEKDWFAYHKKVCKAFRDGPLYLPPIEIF